MTKSKPRQEENNKSIFGDVIYAYSRKEAIEDGVLVDISETSEAKEAGFKIPVVMSANLYAAVQVPKGMEGLQDFKGRLWDVCFMATMAFRKTPDEEKRLIKFKVGFRNGQKEEDYIELEIYLAFNEYEGFTLMLPGDN